MDKPEQLLRFTISSGEGDSQIRQAVIISGAFKTLSAEERPALKSIESGIAALRQWATEQYPDRDDWKIMEDRPMYWPPEWRDEEDA